MWPNPQKTADLVTFTEEILNGELHFLCSVTYMEITSKILKTSMIEIYGNRFFRKKILAGENFHTSWCNPAKYDIVVFTGHRQSYINMHTFKKELRKLI